MREEAVEAWGRCAEDIVRWLMVIEVSIFRSRAQSMRCHRRDLFDPGSMVRGYRAAAAVIGAWIICEEAWSISPLWRGSSDGIDARMMPLEVS